MLLHKKLISDFHASLPKYYICTCTITRSRLFPLQSLRFDIYDVKIHSTWMGRFGKILIPHKNLQEIYKTKQYCIYNNNAKNVMYHCKMVGLSSNFNKLLKALKQQKIALHVKKGIQYLLTNFCGKAPANNIDPDLTAL